MSRSEEKVERGRTVTLSEVDGDLLLGGSTVVPAGSEVVVHGTVTLKGRSVVRGTLKAEEVRGEGDLQVEGDLEADVVKLRDGASLDVAKDLKADDVDVPNTLRVGGRTEVDDLSVGGTATLTGDAKVDDVRVGGTLKAEAKLEASDVKVGGAVEAKEIICDDVKVGGSLRAERVEGDDMNVGGTVEITGEAKLEDLVVGGTANVGKGSVGEVRVGGTFRAAGELSFGGMDVGGEIAMGSGKGEKISVGGVLDVKGDLALEERLDVGGRARVDGAVSAGDITVGGELQAATAISGGGLSVGGKLATAKGAKGGEVDIGRMAQVRGPIIGETVKVREKTETDDIHAGSLWLGDECLVKNVFVRRAEIGRGCVISGRLQYTEAVRMGKDVRLSSPAEKVSQLPSPPV